jgi:hypothetical protein
MTELHMSVYSRNYVWHLKEKLKALESHVSCLQQLFQQALRPLLQGKQKNMVSVNCLEKLHLFFHSCKNSEDFSTQTFEDILMAGGKHRLHLTENFVTFPNIH